MPVNPIGPVAGNQVTTRPARSNAYGTVKTWHTPCSAPTVQDGTVVDADMFNDWLAQLRTTFDSSGIAVDNADDMLWRAIQSANTRWATDTGTANNVVVACTPPVLSLIAGQQVNVKVAAANTGAVTITVDAQAPKAVLFSDGAVLTAGATEANKVARLVYDGVAFRLVDQRSRGFWSSPASITLPTSTFTTASPSSQHASSYLATSTFSNGVFTCGAGEAGLWAFGMFAAYTPVAALGSQDAFVAYINGPRVSAFQSNTQYVGNQGNGASVVLLDRLAVGEQVTFQAFHLQSNGTYNALLYGHRVGA